MKTLTIKLTQHTPLIHFQHDQEGATLRASEVKPRLDKYIIHKAFDDNFDKCKQYLVGYNAKNEEALRSKWNSGYRALDYKMKIKSDNPRNVSMKVDPENDRNDNQKRDSIGRLLFKTPNYPNDKNSLIIGNIGGRIKEEVLNFVMFDSVLLSLLFKNEALYDDVSSNAFDFFSETNFGNRTSKGFGSFFVQAVNNEICNEPPTSDYVISFYLENKRNSQGDKDISEEEAMKDIFIVINKVWRGLKDDAKGKKSVFLKVASVLNENEERIPSPIYFKPYIVVKQKQKWEVSILVFINESIISAASANTKDFREKLDDAVKKQDFQRFINSQPQYSHKISSIEVQHACPLKVVDDYNKFNI